MEFAALSTITSLDDRLIVWLNPYLIRWPLFHLFLKWLLDAHIVKFLPIVLVIVACWFARRSDRDATRRLVLEGVLTAFAALVLARLLALALPFRERPMANPDLHVTGPLDAGMRTWSSFPSDHALVAFALAASLFRISPVIGLWAGLHAIVFISAPRLLFALHYPSDVLAGALIGIALAWLAAHWRGREAVTGFLLNAEARRPGLFYTVAFFALFEIAEMFDSVRILIVNAFRVLRQLTG